MRKKDFIEDFSNNKRQPTIIEKFDGLQIHFDKHIVYHIFVYLFFFARLICILLCCLFFLWFFGSIKIVLVEVCVRCAEHFMIYLFSFGAKTFFFSTIYNTKSIIFSTSCFFFLLVSTILFLYFFLFLLYFIQSCFFSVSFS